MADETDNRGEMARADLVEMWGKLSPDLRITGDMMQLLIAYVTEDGGASIPLGVFQEQTLTAIAGLEGRIVRIERHLGIQ